MSINASILTATVRSVMLITLHHRALKESQGQEAVEQYTKALQSQQAPSIAFAAVLHSNRAAARQLLGQHAEAIADCLRATALNPEYAKASCQCLKSGWPLCLACPDLPLEQDVQQSFSLEGVQSCCLELEVPGTLHEKSYACRRTQGWQCCCQS